jgi:CRP-like cAMP-binding protein
VPPIQDPNQNHLLAALLDAEFDRLSPHLQLVPLLLGDVLSQSGARPDYVYFPTTAIISIHYLLENGGSSEIAGVGNEGMLGVALFMGGNTTPSRAVVQTGGFGYRLPVAILTEEFDRAGPVMRLLLRYTQALLTHMSQTAVCNRHHTVEQQLCRWLLLTLDRLSSNELTMTQELISNMLGVRREGVTEAAGRLQGRGHISYRRGHITTSANAMAWSRRSSDACCRTCASARARRAPASRPERARRLFLAIASGRLAGHSLFSTTVICQTPAIFPSSA